MQSLFLPHKSVYTYCQAQVQIQSRSIPGPFQIYIKSFQSILIQNQMIWTRSWCYFHCVTTTTTQETFLGLILTQNQYRLTSSHDILTILWKRCPEHPSSCQDDPLSSQTPTPYFEDGGHLDHENDIFGRQVLNKTGILNIPTFQPQNPDKTYKTKKIFHPNSIEELYISVKTNLINRKFQRPSKERTTFRKSFFISFSMFIYTDLLYFFTFYFLAD